MCTSYGFLKNPLFLGVEIVRKRNVGLFIRVGTILATLSVRAGKKSWGSDDHQKSGMLALFFKSDSEFAARDPSDHEDL